VQVGSRLVKLLYEPSLLPSKIYRLATKLSLYSHINRVKVSLFGKKLLIPSTLVGTGGRCTANWSVRNVLKEDLTYESTSTQIWFLALSFTW
jgi:hypothetical protein